MAPFYLLVGKQNVFLAIGYLSKMNSNLIKCAKFVCVLEVRKLGLLE